MNTRAQAKYEISAEDRTKKALDSASRGLKGLKDSVLSVQGALAGLGAAFSLKAVIDATVRQEAALAQLDAALRSTGGAIGYTRDQLATMAAELQGVTTFGDEAIIEAQARLVTYTGIVGENFPRALQAVLDQSARLNIGLEQSAEVIGRALESPMKAAESLARQGFGAAFTKEVRATIRALVESGREAEAQVMVLEILEGAYGGAARAARDTFGGALKALGNAFGDLLEANGGGLNEAKAALEDLTALLSDPRTVAAADALTSTIIKGFKGAAEALTTFVGIAGMLGENLARSIGGPSDPVERLDEKIAGLTARVREIDTELARPRVFRINPFVGTDALRGELEALQQRIEDLQRARAALAQYVPPAPRTPAATGGGAGGARPVSAGLAIPPIDVTRALLDRQTALLRDALSRQMQDLDRAYQDGLTSTATYFAERGRLQAESLDAELTRLRGMLAQAQREEAAAAAATATTEGEARSAIAAVTRAREQQIQLTGQITVLERDRAAIAGTTARDQAAAERELARDLAQVRIRLLELTGQSAEARRLALEREYQTLVQRLAAEGDAEGQALVRRLFDVETARSQLDQLQNEFDLAMQRMATQEQRIGVQRDASLLSELQARREIIALHQRTGEEVGALIPKMLELAAATGDPAALERVKQMEVQVKRLGVVVDETNTRLAGAIESGLANALADVITGAASASEAFRAFANVVMQELARIAAQKLAAQLIGGMFGGFGAAAGAAVMHSGGIVGGGAGSRRAIPALAFSAAPRYHSGGIAGLAPDEVPAILRKGEEVITEGDPRHRGNSGGDSGQPPRNMRFIFVDDSRDVANWMRSADSDDVFIEKLQRNAAVIRSVVG